MALGAAYKEPQSEDLDKDKNSDADYDNDYVLCCADVFWKTMLTWAKLKNIRFLRIIKSWFLENLKLFMDFDLVGTAGGSDGLQR